MLKNILFEIKMKVHMSPSVYLRLKSNPTTILMLLFMFLKFLSVRCFVKKQFVKIYETSIYILSIGLCLLLLLLHSQSRYARAKRNGYGVGRDRCCKYLTTKTVGGPGVLRAYTTEILN